MSSDVYALLLGKDLKLARSVEVEGVIGSALIRVFPNWETNKKKYFD